MSGDKPGKTREGKGSPGKGRGREGKAREGNASDFASRAADRAATPSAEEGGQLKPKWGSTSWLMASLSTTAATFGLAVAFGEQPCWLDGSSEAVGKHHF